MRLCIVQKFIDKIRNKQLVPFNEHIPLIVPKIITLNSILNEIDTLILGSSHPQLGYIAKKNEFNMFEMAPMDCLTQIVKSL